MSHPDFGKRAKGRQSSHRPGAESSPPRRGQLCNCVGRDHNRSVSSGVFAMPMQTIRVRFATNRNRVTGAALFGNNFEGNDPKRYVTGSIDVERRSNLPDTGWSPLPGTLVIDPPTTPLVANVGAPVAAAAGLRLELPRRDAPGGADRLGLQGRQRLLLLVAGERQGPTRRLPGGSRR